MYQPGGYPPNPAYSNQNAPYPQPQYYQAPSAMPMAPYGAAQQRSPHHPDPGQVLPGREFEVRNENPCHCFCALTTAAKTLAVFNLFYLVMELVDLIAPNSPFYWGRDSFLPGFPPDYRHSTSYYEELVPGQPRRLTDLGLYYDCMNYQRHKNSYFYIAILTLFIANILAYFGATIVFMIAIFGGLGTKIETLSSKIFMMASLTYLGWLFHILLFVDLLVQRKKCQRSSKVWWRYIVTGVCIGLFSMFNGFVGRGYRNLVKQRSEAKGGGPGGPQQQQQGIGGEIPATSSMTMHEAESISMKMVPEPGTGQS